MSGHTIPDGYYAVRDPHEPDRVTYWHAATIRGRHAFAPWPSDARSGPLLSRAALPDRRRHPDEHQRALDDWLARRADYDQTIRGAIAADPAAAAALFAAFTTRCASCGRHLTDRASKTIGLGPDCRAGMPADALAARSEAVGRAHAEWLAHLDAA